jgi:hypothetical protein
MEQESETRFDPNFAAQILLEIAHGQPSTAFIPPLTMV